MYKSPVCQIFHVYTLKPVDYLCSQVPSLKILKSVIRFVMFIFVIFKDSLGQMIIWALVQKKKIQILFFLWSSVHTGSENPEMTLLSCYLLCILNHSAPPLWFPPSFLWTEYVWQILILSENAWLSFTILFIFIAQSPAGEEKNEDNLVNNEHRDGILFSCNEE